MIDCQCVIYIVKFNVDKEENHEIIELKKIKFWSLQTIKFKRKIYMLIYLSYTDE